MGKLIITKCQERKTVCGFFNFSNLQYLDLWIFESRQFWIFSTSRPCNFPILVLAIFRIISIHYSIPVFFNVRIFRFLDLSVLEYFNFPSSSAVLQSLDILTYEFPSSWISQLIMHLHAATSGSQAMINRWIPTLRNFRTVR